MFLETSLYVQENTCGGISLFNKVAGHQAYNFIKKRTQQLFSSEYYEIFKNSIFHRTPPVAAFGKSFDILNGGVLGLCQTPMMELLVKIVDSY